MVVELTDRGLVEYAFRCLGDDDGERRLFMLRALLLAEADDALRCGRRHAFHDLMANLRTLDTATRALGTYRDVPARGGTPRDALADSHA